MSTFETITSPSNPRVRAAVALRDADARRDTGLTLVDGRRAGGHKCLPQAAMMPGGRVAREHQGAGGRSAGAGHECRHVVNQSREIAVDREGFAAGAVAPGGWIEDGAGEPCAAAGLPGDERGRVPADPADR